MDSLFYEHIKSTAMEQFPKLVAMVGPEQAGREMAYGLWNYRHMLYPQEILEIGQSVIREVLGEEYQPSPYIEPDERVGFDADGNYHFLYIPPNIIRGEE